LTVERTEHGSSIQVLGEGVEEFAGEGVDAVGGDDGGAVGEGDVEGAAEGGGGEDHGHHGAGGGDADVVEERGWVIVGGPGAVQVDVGDAGGHGAVFLVEVSHAVGGHESADDGTDEHSERASLGDAAAFLERVLPGDGAEEEVGVAEILSAAEDVGEAEEEAEGIGDVGIGVRAEVDDGADGQAMAMGPVFEGDVAAGDASDGGHEEVVEGGVVSASGLVEGVDEAWGRGADNEADGEVGSAAILDAADLS